MQRINEKILFVVVIVLLLNTFYVNFKYLEYAKTMKEYNHKLDDLFTLYSKLQRKIVHIEKVGDTGNMKFEIEQAIKSIHDENEKKLSKWRTHEQP